MTHNQAIKSIGGCKVCGGTGYVLYTCTDSRDFVSTYDVFCIDCNGTGNAEIIERIPIDVPSWCKYFCIYRERLYCFEFDKELILRLIDEPFKSFCKMDSFKLPYQVGQNIELECDVCNEKEKNKWCRACPDQKECSIKFCSENCNVTCPQCKGNPKLTVTVESVEVQDREFVITGRVR